MPAQKISSAKAASTSASTSHSTAKDGRLMPMFGKPKQTNRTRTSGGNARNMSTNTTISALTASRRKVRMIASASPSRVPVTTTAAAISIVTTTPFMMAGKYRSITSQLKNVSRKRDQDSMAISPRELGDEGAGARLAGCRKHLLRRPLLHDDPVIHEDHAVGSVARKPHLVAHHQHGHAAAFELAHHVEYAAHQLRIERGGGLVEQHHLGFERERASDRHPLLLAARKLAGIRACLRGKAHAIERRHPNSLRFGP